MEINRKNPFKVPVGYFDDLEEIQFKKKFIDSLGHKTELLGKNKTLKIEPILNEYPKDELLRIFTEYSELRKNPQ